jgi:hypothetical protein
MATITRFSTEEYINSHLSIGSQLINCAIDKWVTTAPTHLRHKWVKSPNPTHSRRSVESIAIRRIAILLFSYCVCQELANSRVAESSQGFIIVAWSEFYSVSIASIDLLIINIITIEPLLSPAYHPFVRHYFRWSTQSWQCRYNSRFASPTLPSTSTLHTVTTIPAS